MRWLDLMALFLCILWLAPPLAAAPAEITAIVVDLQQLQRSEDVQLIRAAATAREPLVLGVKLQTGDSLESFSGKTVVELKCPNGTLYTFRNKFRIVLVPPSKAGCAVDVLSGSLDVLADRPTEVNAGGTHLGSEGTVYSVTVNNSAGAIRLRIAVFEGQVKISGDEPIGQGAALAIRDRERLRSRIDRVQDIFPVAAAFARLDVARAKTAERASKAFRILKERHAEVLAMPDNREQRIMLARTQLFYGVQNSNTSYQLRRLGMTERELQKDPELDLDQGDALNCEVRIIEAGPNQEVKGKIEVNGSARIPDGHHLWVFVRSIDARYWWPQGKVTFDSSTGNWSASAHPHVPEAVPSDFELTAAVVTEELHWKLKGTLSSPLQPDKAQLIALPAATCVAPVVMVRNVSPPDPSRGNLECSVHILEPRPRQGVKGRIMVEGNAIYGDAGIPESLHLWVFARPTRLRHLSWWWPQNEGPVEPDTGKWSVVAILGGSKDVGENFDLTAAVFTSDGHQKLSGYLENAMRLGDFRPIEMPAAVCSATAVEVKRTQ